MRLATYNVEWFTRLFNDVGDLLDDASWSARHNITRAQQAAAIADVLKGVDADGVMLIEAPDSHGHRDGKRALENFAQHFGLRTRCAQLGFINDTKQEISFLYDPDVLDVRHDPHHTDTVPRFDRQHTNEYGAARWSKPPLELKVKKGHAKYRVIGVHAKSKATHGAEDVQATIKIACENRRKHLAQCAWLRARVDQFLADDLPVIVMGDVNDGPGLDAYEARFGQSGLELILGEGDAALFDPHGAIKPRSGDMPTSARFYVAGENRFVQYLLDYIMVSKRIRSKVEWRIWHPFDDAACWENLPLRHALLTASDHFPITIDISAAS